MLREVARGMVMKAHQDGNLITAKDLDDIENKVYSKVIFNMHYSTTKQHAIEVRNISKMGDDMSTNRGSVSIGGAKRNIRRARGVPVSVDIAHPHDSPNAYLNKSIQAENKRNSGFDDLFA